jgi:putative PIN family toxin of toxin-antitoxin system
LKIVLDTNVIVSALLTPAGIPAKILNLILNNSVTMVYDNNILSEYIDVLGRSELKISKKSADVLIDFIQKEGEFRISSPLRQKFSHEGDKKFYEAYKSAETDYLVTGNIKHFPKEKGIVTPRMFLDNEIMSYK